MHAAPRRRRVLRGVVYALIGLVVLALVALALAHTSAGKRMARSAAVSYLRGRVGGDFEIQGLDYWLWRGEFRAEGIHWSSSDESISVEVESATAFIRPGAAPAIAVQSPEVGIVQTDDEGGDAETSVSLPAWLFGLDLSVTDGSFRLSAPAQDPWLAVQSFDARLEPTLEGWDGDLAFDHARFRRGALDFGVGPGTMQVAVVPREVDVSSIEIRKDVARFAGSARVSSFSPFAFEADLSHRFDGALVKELLPDIDVDATFDGESTVSFESGAWRGRGSLRSSGLTYEPLEPLDFEAPWALDGNLLRVDDARVGAYGGSARVTAVFDLDADAQSLDVSFDGLAPPFDNDFVRRVSGAISVGFEGWDMANGRGEGYLEPEPLRGRVSLRLEGGAVVFDGPELEGPGLSLSVSGRASDTLMARFHAIASDVSRIEPWLADFRIEGAAHAEGTVEGAWSSLVVFANVSTEGLTVADVPLDLEAQLRLTPPRIELREVSLQHPSGGWLRLRGSYDLEGEALALRGEGDGFELTEIPETVGRVSSIRFDLEGPLRSIRGNASARVETLRYREVELPDIGVEVEADGQGATIVARLPDSRVLASARVALTAPYAAEVRARLENLPVRELIAMTPALAEAETEIEPRGGLWVGFDLSELGSLRYRVDGEQILGIYRGVGFGVSAPFTIQGDLGSLEVSELILIGTDTAIGVDGLVPLSPEEQLALHARGAASLGLLSLWLPEAEPEGRANLDLRVSGTLDDPRIEGDLLLAEASARWNEIAVDGVELVSRVRDNVVTVEKLGGNILGGRFGIEGNVPMGRDSRTASLRFRLDEIDPMRLAPEDGFGVDPGQMHVSVSGELEGPPLAPSEWQGGGRIEQLSAREGAAEIELAEPGPWSLESGHFRVSGLRLLSGETELVLEGEVAPFLEPLSWSARASGQLDNALLAPTLLDLGIVFTGTTTIDVRASGGAEPLALGGTVTVSNGRLALREPALTFTNLSGAVELEGDLVTLTRLDASVGGGSAEARGQFRLADGSIADLDLTGQVRSMRLSYPEGLRSEIDGEVRLLGTPPELQIAGDVTLARAIFSRNITLETELLQSLSRVRVVAPTESMAAQIRLDLRVRTLEGLRVDNNLATMEASANLNVGGTIAAPEISGIVTARPQGEFRFARNTYRIETGRIQLQSYPSEPAELDFTAETKVGEYEIRLVVRGSTDDLVTELTSNDPDLSRGDVVSLLLTGRRTEDLTREGRTVLGEQMVSYLGAGLGELAELGLGGVLPFDIITRQPTLIAGETNPAARFTLGAALTESLSVVYSIGLENAESQIWIVDYQLPRRLRTQLIRQEDNELTAALGQQLPFYFGRRPTRVEEPRTEVARVGFYFISGEPEDLESRARDRIDVDPGDRYDYWDTWEKAERLRDWLRREGFLQATVDLDPIPCGEGCVELDFYVATGKRVRFVWEGDEPSENLKKALAEAWEGYLSDAFLTSDLALLAESRLFAQRYYLAHAEFDVRDLGTEIVVTARIAQGPRGTRVALDFTGNEALSDHLLAQALPRRTSAEFYELITSKQPRLKQILANRYASQGYLQTDMGDLVRSYDVATGVLTLTIPIVEGPRTLVDRVELEGVEGLDETLVRSSLSLREGDPFRVSDFVRDRTGLASFYRRQGFPDVEVDAAVLRDGDPERLGARYTVREGSRVTVGDIRVAGNEATRESVIRREIALEPGAPLRIAEMSQTQRQLYDLGIFRSAEVVVSEPGPELARRDVVVEVTEAPDVVLDYGFRYSTDGLFEILGEVAAPNLFGRAQFASFRTLLSSEQAIFRFTYRTPYLFRYRLNTDFFVERIEKDETPEDPAGLTVTEDIAWTFTAQQSRPVREHLMAQWSYSYERALVAFEQKEDDFFPPEPIDLRGSVFGGALIGDHRDSVVRPTQGSFWNVTLRAAPQAKTPEYRYLRFYGQLYTYIPLGRGLVWAAGYRVGAIKSFFKPLYEGQGEPGLLKEERFQAGGPNSVRGFKLDSLGPIDEGVMERIGGSGLLVFNQEIRFPIAWRMRGVGFYDVGNVFEPVSSMSLTDLRHSAGAGLRLEVPFGLFRVDWAFALDHREDEDPWRFIFTLGHAF